MSNYTTDSRSTTASNIRTHTTGPKLDIAQLLNGKVVSSFGSTDGKTSISEDTISLPDGRTVTVREVTDLTQRKEPTDFGTTASNTSRVSGNTTATNN